MQEESLRESRETASVTKCRQLCRLLVQTGEHFGEHSLDLASTRFQRVLAQCSLARSLGPGGERALARWGKLRASPITSLFTSKLDANFLLFITIVFTIALKFVSFSCLLVGSKFVKTYLFSIKRQSKVTTFLTCHYSIGGDCTGGRTTA